MNPTYIFFIILFVAIAASVAYTAVRIRKHSSSRDEIITGGSASGSNSDREVRELCKTLSGEELYNKACELVDAKGYKTDYSKWEAFMSAAAKKDYIPAIREWGIHNSYKNNAVAAELLYRAAGEGDGKATEELYDMYYFGVDHGTPKIKKDRKKAVDVITPFAENGNAVALRLIGKYYNYTEHNEEKALEYYLKAAEGGDAQAMYEASEIYYTKDETAKQKELLLKAAEQNYADAEDMLGIMYADPDEFGEGEANYERAMYWYKRASEHGDSSATYHVGEMYLNGQGVIKDESQAFNWFKKAKDQGSVYGEYLCGKCYLEGTGVAQDKSKGIELYRSAAKYDSDAQYALGLCYLEGNGVEKNVKKAAYYLNKAATDEYDQNEEAQAKLEELYASGVIKKGDL